MATATKSMSEANRRRVEKTKRMIRTCPVHGKFRGFEWQGHRRHCQIQSVEETEAKMARVSTEMKNGKEKSVKAATTKKSDRKRPVEAVRVVETVLDSEVIDPRRPADLKETKDRESKLFLLSKIRRGSVKIVLEGGEEVHIASVVYNQDDEGKIAKWILETLESLENEVG